jgi:ribonuclease G
MIRRLLIAASPGELWAALAEDNEAVALRLVRTDGAPRRGDVFLGRVVALRPELPAALVDIGAVRPAFLGVKEMPREGEAMIVKVTRPARADKAATVTAKLTPEDMAQAKTGSSAAPPILLHRRETALVELFGQFAAMPFDAVVIDDAATFATARPWLAGHRPELEVTLYRDSEPLFDANGVGGVIETAVSPRIALAGGGAITIESTLAATLIDVDGGEESAMAANLASVREIVRQIRLRDIAGPIVVDFIGMTNRGQRARVAAALDAALSDADEVQVLGWTRLGHFEMLRPRRRPSLAEMLFEHEPSGGRRKTSLTVALEALRRLDRETRQAPAVRYRLRVSADVAAVLAGAASGALRNLEARLGRRVVVTADSRPRENFDIEPSGRPDSPRLIGRDEFR